VVLAGFMYLPATQGVQMASLTAVFHVPATHGVHAEALTAPKSPAVNVNTRSALAPAIRVFDTVTVSPTAYPLPALPVVTVTPVTALAPAPVDVMTIVKRAPEPPPFVVVAKPVRVAVFVASVGFPVIFVNN
jgi:hypothetical protein